MSKNEPKQGGTLYTQHVEVNNLGNGDIELVTDGIPVRRMNVLVCASHCDDECLGMGATIAKLSDAGHTVYCWFYFSGTNCNGAMQEQPEEVAKILGTRYPPFVMPMTVDNESDTIPILDIARSIEDTIDKVKPEIVYTHLINDLNVDHRRVAEATIIATRPRVGSVVDQVLSYEIPSSTDWSFGQLGGRFGPNVYEEVSVDNYNKKVLALGAYGNIIKHKPPVSAMCELRGHQSGVELAEAFELIWERR